VQAVFSAPGATIPSLPSSLALAPDPLLTLVAGLFDAARATRDEGRFWYAVANVDRLPAPLAIEGALLKARGYAAFGQRELALHAAREAIELSPEDPRSQAALFEALGVEPNLEAVVALAEGTFVRGDSAEAMGLFLDAIRLGPGTVDAWIGLAVSVHALGKGPQALSALDRALSIAPDHPVALLNRFRIAVDIGRADDAIETGRRYVTRFPNAPETAEIRAMLPTESR
jgi:tetratricopeptide (TPR) repeat protein